MPPKDQLADLAIFGPAPAFATPVHVGRPNLPDRARFLQAVNGILDRNILTNDGPEVRALEERFCRLTDAGHAVAVSNATIGLFFLARALGLSGRVVMPAFTFVATAHAFKWIGLEPVFCDVDPATHNLDPVQVRRHLQAGACAVVGVHLWGRLCAPLELEAICREQGIPLVFDSAHALGCSGFGRAVGAFGTAEVFSLHATKICHSFEGGIITTNDSSLAKKLRQMRNFGFSGYDQVDYLGINAKMPEVSAAMGVLSLESLEQYRAVNQRNYQLYQQELAAVPGLRFAAPAPGEQSNYHYVVVEFSAPWPAGARDAVYQTLHAEGVLVRRYFYPGCHRAAPYRDEASSREPLPVTDTLCQNVLCFPNGSSIDDGTIKRICALTALVLSGLPAVQQQLARVKK